MTPARKEKLHGEENLESTRPEPPRRLRLVANRGEVCPRRLLEDNAEWIATAAAKVARRSHLSPEESEDFCGWAVLRLMSKDFSLLRACRDTRLARAYLRTVLRNLIRDYRNHIWGKWRPSAGSRDLGPDGVALEELCHRDGLSLREAVEILSQGRGPFVTERLEEIAQRLPTRLRREQIELDAEKMPTPATVPASLAASEASRVRVETVLSLALASIGEIDRRVLYLHFVEGRSLAWIARTLNLPQRPIYSRRDRCLRLLLRCFENQGLSWSEIAPLFDPGGEGSVTLGELVLPQELSSETSSAAPAQYPRARPSGRRGSVAP